MNRKIYIFSIIIIFVFGYILFEAYKLENKFAGDSADKAGTVIQNMPNLKFSLASDSDKNLELYQLTGQGKNVFVHFWATWCAPCEKEFPELVKMIHLFKDKKNIQFVLVAVNDDPKKMKKFLKQFDLNLDNVSLVEDKINSHKELGTYKLPETFVFNSENKIVKKYTGQQPWLQKYIVDQIKSL
ncbi:MAG: hypothetical protein CME62_16255 [Halobacteriovoraceae bacterium]|nr:hypothetical protein [Halobacteriovoraceae bacterium]|tara:strand:+ start:116 stop:670 length:555 start_codon:yes stop_codon:yes gene_type:complete